jgi:phytoene synthase
MRSPSVPGLRPDDLVHCRRVLRAGSRSFHAASLLLARDVRDAVAPVYAFCRTADDLVDSGWAGRRTILLLRDRIAGIYHDGELTDSIDRALRAVVIHRGIPRVVFDALLEGFAWEIEGRRYETPSDLYAYGTRVAGTVGVAVTHVVGCADRHTLARACDLGAAMQLTNIARDVGEDARAGRLYLPLTWMREEGIAPDAWLANPVFTPSLGCVVRRLLDAADHLYDRADAGIPRLPARSRAGIAAARLIYADIGRVIAATGYDSVSQRAYTSPRRKLQLAARAIGSQAASRPRDASAAPLSEAAFLVNTSTGGTGDSVRPPARATTSATGSRSIPIHEGAVS